MIINRQEVINIVDMDSRRFNIEDSGYRCEQRIRFGTDKLFLKEGHEVAAGMRANSNSDALDSLKKEYSTGLRLSSWIWKTRVLWPIVRI